MSSEEIDERIEIVGKAITVRYLLIVVILILNIAVIAITSAGLGYAQSKLKENPLYEVQTYYGKLSKDSRAIGKDYTTSTTEFNLETSLKNIVNREDPTQLLIRDLIFLERDFQDFILYTQMGIRDLAKLIGGIDEWLYYQQADLRKYITNSRKRQKALRGLLKKRKKNTHAVRKLL